MIVTGCALPLPSLYDEIIDCVETWGATFKCGWNVRVYKFIYTTIAEDDQSKRTVFGECLFPLVRAKIDKYFLLEKREAMFNLWIDYFDVNFDKGADFFALAVGSLRLVRESAEEASAALFIIPDSTPEHDVPSCPDIVPPSPVSSQVAPPGEWTN